jgi:hypothetical protein
MLMHPFRSNTWRSQITLHVLQICFVSSLLLQRDSAEKSICPMEKWVVRRVALRKSGVGEVATKNMHFFKNMKESRQTYENLMNRREADIKSR